eukprot:3371926-Pleurochrysis_carterae.AAC.2
MEMQKARKSIIKYKIPRAMKIAARKSSGFHLTRTILSVRGISCRNSAMQRKNSSLALSYRIGQCTRTHCGALRRRIARARVGFTASAHSSVSVQLTVRGAEKWRRSSSALQRYRCWISKVFEHVQAKISVCWSCVRNRESIRSPPRALPHLSMRKRGHCRIGVEGCKALAEALKSNDTVTELNSYRTRLAFALTPCHSQCHAGARDWNSLMLRVVCVYVCTECGIRVQDCKLLAEALKTNKTLCDLDLCGARASVHLWIAGDQAYLADCLRETTFFGKSTRLVATKGPWPRSTDG